MEVKQKLMWFLLFEPAERRFSLSCQKWVCVFSGCMSSIPTITSDTGPSGGCVSTVIQSDATARDRNVFAERLYLPEGWNWHLLCCYLYCCLLLLFNSTFVLVPSVSLSWTSQSVSELSGLSCSLPLSSPYPPSFSSRVCACSIRHARKCCASSRGSSCATTACRWGTGGRLRRCSRDLCPWRSVRREPPPSASATASCVMALDSQSPSPTDWPRRRPWWPGDAATFAFVPNADDSRDWGCVRQRPQGHFLLPHTVTRA